MLKTYIFILFILLSSSRFSQILKYEDLCNIIEIGMNRYPLEQFLESKGYKYVDYYEDKFNKVIKYSCPDKEISQNFYLSISNRSSGVAIWYTCYNEKFYSYYKEVVVKHQFVYRSDFTQKFDKAYVVVYENSNYLLHLIKKPISFLTEYSLQLVKTN